MRMGLMFRNISEAIRYVSSLYTRQKIHLFFFFIIFNTHFVMYVTAVL